MVTRLHRIALCALPPVWLGFLVAVWQDRRLLWRLWCLQRPAVPMSILQTMAGALLVGGIIVGFWVFPVTAPRVETLSPSSPVLEECPSGWHQYPDTNGMMVCDATPPLPALAQRVRQRPPPPSLPCTMLRSVILNAPEHFTCTTDSESSVGPGKREQPSVTPP